MKRILCSLALLLAMFTTAPTQPAAAQCSGYTHSMFPPPMLPECDGTWDTDCIAKCNVQYSETMVRAYTLWCFRMAGAYEAWLTANDLCVEAYDTCMAGATTPQQQQACLDNCNTCLSNAAAARNATETAANNSLAADSAAAVAAYYKCVAQCCIHPPAP